DRHVFAALLTGVESHAASRKRKEGVVFAHADVDARVHPSAALTDDNVAADHVLTAELLHTEATASRIATVARATACFLMCHLELLLGLTFCRPWERPLPWTPSWPGPSSRLRACRPRPLSSAPPSEPWLPSLRPERRLRPAAHPRSWRQLPSSALRPSSRRPGRCAAASSAGDGRPCGDSCAGAAS